MPHPVLERAATYRQQLLAQERAAATRLVDAYGRAYVAIRNNADALEERIRAGVANGETWSDASLRRLPAMRSLPEQIRDEVEKYANVADAQIVQGVQRSIRAGLDNSLGLVQAHFPDPSSRAMIAARFDMLPVDAVETILGMTADDSPLRTRLVGRLGDAVADQVTNSLVDAMIRGVNPRETARIIRQQMGAGLTWSLTTARTAQLYAYREATRQNYLANSTVISGWRWLSALDRRTCACCLGYHGQEFPSTQTLNGHHNCRCAMIPIVPLAKSMGIEPPKMESGETWLRRQNADTQREILGAGIYDAWRGGNVALRDLAREYDDPVYGEMRRAATLQEALTGRGRVPAPTMSPAMVQRVQAPVVPPVPPVPPQAALPSQAPRDKVAETFSGDNYRTFGDSGIGGMTKYYKPWAESFTEQERAALIRYQEMSFSFINIHLRHQLPADLSDLNDIPLLDAIIGRSSVPYNMHSYRGLKIDRALGIGETFEDKGFVSTSLSRNAAANYAKGRDGDAIFEVKLKAGQKGAFVDSVTSRDEYEMLLPRGTNFRVVSIREETWQGKTFTVYTAEIPDGP